MYTWSNNNQTCLNTGLPTNDESSEMTVRNLYCLFPYIYDSYNYKLVSFFTILFISHIYLFKAEDQFNV